MFAFSISSSSPEAVWDRFHIIIIGITFTRQTCCSILIPNKSTSVTTLILFFHFKLLKITIALKEGDKQLRGNNLTLYVNNMFVSLHRSIYNFKRAKESTRCGPTWLPTLTRDQNVPIICLTHYPCNSIQRSFPVRSISVIYLVIAQIKEVLLK